LNPIFFDQDIKDET